MSIQSVTQALKVAQPKTVTADGDVNGLYADGRATIDNDEVIKKTLPGGLLFTGKEMVLKKFDFDFCLRATPTKYVEWIERRYPSVRVECKGKRIVLRFKNFLHSAELTLTAELDGLLQVVGFYTAPRSLAWMESFGEQSLKFFPVDLSKQVHSEQAATLQLKPAGRPRDGSYNDAYTIKVQSGDKEAFKYFCTTTGITNPDKETRTAFKAAMKRRQKDT